MGEQKALQGVTVKDADMGQVEAVFATFNVVDKDGDITETGAFEDGAAVRISAYGHQSWQGRLPVGKGVIRQTDDAAVLDGQFFLGTRGGQETFEVVKQLGDLQEWSYGFDILKAADPLDDDDKAVRRRLQQIKTHEVSPVLLGAGVDTRTLLVKGETAEAPDADAATSFADEGDRALAHVAAFVDRSKALAALRAKDGRAVSAANRDRLTTLAAALSDSADALKELLADSDPDKDRQLLDAEILRYEELRTALIGANT